VLCRFEYTLSPVRSVRQQAKAYAGPGQDEARVGRIVAQLVADVADRDAQIMRIIGMGGPQKARMGEVSAR
jgi:hypothetical protein